MQRISTSFVPLVSVAIFCFAGALTQVVEDDLLYLPVSYSFIMTIITTSMTMTIMSISSKVLVLPADLYSPPKHPAAASWDSPAPHSSHNQAFLPPPGKYLILQSSHQLSPVSWELDLKLSSQKISQNTTRPQFPPCNATQLAGVGIWLWPGQRARVQCTDLFFGSDYHDNYGGDGAIRCNMIMTRSLGALTST